MSNATPPARSGSLVLILLLVVGAAGIAAYVAMFGVPEFLRSPAPPVT